MQRSFGALAGRMINDYRLRIRMFSPNARLYLFNVIISGISMGVFRLLFNFYVLSLGFDEVLLGLLLATPGRPTGNELIKSAAGRQ